MAGRTCISRSSEKGSWSDFRCSPKKEGTYGLYYKRVIDFILAFFGLVLLTPFIGLICLGIKINSPGPLIFSQERCGRFGKRFTLYKFRTMPCSADACLAELLPHNEAHGPVFKMADDPRVETPFQKLLRKTGFDELPQLYNVLRGEMSIVGPRPPLPSEVAEYTPSQMRRLAGMPGLTCTWQVQPRRNKISFDRWVSMDITYLESCSLRLDVHIMIRTIPAVIFGYGV
jgi:lipopolysaccharide/colanic/teichoic acid biosynthesis glycosyltransferase